VIDLSGQTVGPCEFVHFFLVVSYNMLKKRGIEGGEELTSARTLLYAAEASQSYLVLSILK